MKIKIPPLGQGLSEVVLIEVKVTLGRQVVKGDEIALVESDKAVHPIDAPVDGVILTILAQPGARLSVGETFCVLGDVANFNTDSKITEYATPSNSPYRIRSASVEDIPEIYRVWHVNQRLATAGKTFEIPVNAYEDLKESLLTCREPFGAFVATENNQVVGWVSLLPCKNSPVSRNWAAEVSLYVDNPEASINPAVYLMNYAISSARSQGMSFLIGYSNQSNERSDKLLKVTGFRCLGRIGAHTTILWCYDC